MNCSLKDGFKEAKRLLKTPKKDIIKKPLNNKHNSKYLLFNKNNNKYLGEEENINLKK